MWRAWLAEHGLRPEDAAIERAQLLAALSNGPLTRKDKRLFKASDFIAEPWPAPAPPPKKRSRRELAAALRGSLGAGKRGGRHG